VLSASPFSAIGEEILLKQAEYKTNPTDFSVYLPLTMASIERVHWAVSSESKIKPNGKKTG
jgi:hypothetical protein